MSNFSWYCIYILLRLLLEYSYFKAMTIIGKLSFWIMKPKKKSIITELPCKTVEQFEELILDALAKFKTEGYVKKLKTSITQESLPSNKEDLLEFLYNQIA
jgi:hypothetical protein